MPIKEDKQWSVPWGSLLIMAAIHLALDDNHVLILGLRELDTVDASAHVLVIILINDLMTSLMRDNVNDR
jgi:hypothetical protein